MTKSYEEELNEFLEEYGEFLEEQNRQEEREMWSRENGQHMIKTAEDAGLRVGVL